MGSLVVYGVSRVILTFGYCVAAATGLVWVVCVIELQFARVRGVGVWGVLRGLLSLGLLRVVLGLLGGFACELGCVFFWLFSWAI